MAGCLRFTVAMLIAVVVLAVPWSGTLAQGVTGSAITGTVSKEGGAGPLEGASVQLRNPATGDTFTAVSGPAGRYTLDNLPPGGPYVLTATAEGYQPATQADIQLTLGQRSTVDVTMRKEFVEEIAVVAHLDQLGDKERTGAGTVMKGSTILELPLQGRNFTDLIATDPRVTGAGGGGQEPSIAGQNNRFNNILIDGGANNDLFGLASSGTPGGQANAKPLSVEAIQEFVVQVAPFDVRLGNFAGGLVNAVTKSGTNDFHGSLFGYFQNKSLAGFRDDVTFTGYNTWQYGLSLGGPIVKDKAHFFLTTDLQTKSSAFGSPFNLGGSPGPGFDAATAQRFINDLAKYGVTGVGDASSPDLSNPDRNLFIKVTSSALEDSHLELSYNLVNANLDVLGRIATNPSRPTPTSPGRVRDGYQLSNSGYTFYSTTNTVRGKLTTNWQEGALSNEFLAGGSFVRENRSVPVNAPLIIVGAGNLGAATTYLAAGGERFSQDNLLNQDIWQVQDNITYALGAHRITLGTSNEFFTFRNVFLQAATGAWFFTDLNSFEAGTPLAYQRRFGNSDQVAPGTALFHVSQLGFYAQDEWSLLKNLSVTPGIRMDVPLLSAAPQNPAYLSVPGLPIDTSKVPSGNILWSPRLGFNWDVEGNADTIVRGGVGIFSGRPPYVWVSNAYTINGLSQVELDCFGGPGGNGVPPFTADPKAQPTSCAGGTGKPVAPPGEVDYFDPNTKYPQNLRYALGADKRLLWGLVGTVDFLYTRDINGWYTTDTNLNDLGKDGDGREIYGTFNPANGAAKTSRINTSQFVQAIEVYNKNGGYAYSATAQLQKTFARRFNISAAYTYARSYDRISFTSSQALSNFQFTPLDGTLTDRSVRPSEFDRPHKITITGTAALPYGFQVGLSYVGVSGTPYTYVVSGDANGDGISNNDLVFVPADPTQINLVEPKGAPVGTAWAALNSFIQGQDCLRAARGTFIQRGACRNPWEDFLDLRISWRSPKLRGDQLIEVQWDIFNVLNLLNSRWGHVNQVAQFETGPAFLGVVGYDNVTTHRPIYSFRAPPTIVNTVYSPTLSRWRMQLGARVLF